MLITLIDSLKYARLTLYGNVNVEAAQNEFDRQGLSVITPTEHRPSLPDNLSRAVVGRVCSSLAGCKRNHQGCVLYGESARESLQDDGPCTAAQMIDTHRTSLHQQYASYADLVADCISKFPPLLNAIQYILNPTNTMDLYTNVEGMSKLPMPACWFGANEARIVFANKPTIYTDANGSDIIAKLAVGGGCSAKDVHSVLPKFKRLMSGPCGSSSTYTAYAHSPRRVSRNSGPPSHSTKRKSS